MLLYKNCGVKVGDLIYWYLYVYLEVGIGREVRHWSTYMYDLTFLYISWLIANMAEMPGVRQIDGSCPIFQKFWKIILNIVGYKFDSTVN